VSNSTTIEWLSKAIAQATRSAKFCALGSLGDVDAGIDVEGLGAIQLPLKRTMVKELVGRCHAAPYGKGTKTLLDSKVRNTFELDPKKFSLSDEWSAAIAAATRSVAQQLGLPAEQLEARLYKLLVYERGGFFVPHRDSEKHDRMVASLIVVLPNPFEGGSLIIRHGAVKQTFRFEEAAKGKAPCYAAFYADCEHEVERVTGGVRLCLAYNLVLKQRKKSSAAAKSAAGVDAIAASIRSWVAMQPAQPLVCALDHHYTQRGLALDLLKGADRRLADLIVSAAEKTDCLIHLAQVSRHLLQFADDGSFGDYYSRWDRPVRRDLEIGETYEDDLSGTEWTDLQGKKQPWGEIAFDLSAIVSSVPIDDWKPTSEEYEGYTGNAGNTLDRWYHRSAIVLWHRDHHFEVVARSGADASIPLFCSMATKLAKVPKKRLEDARRDCIRFGRAIMANWPHRGMGFGDPTTGETSPYAAFLEHLLTLHDRDTIAMLLAEVAERDPALRLKSFVVGACREFGWNAFEAELKERIASRSDRPDQQEIPLREVEWLSGFCCDPTSDPARSALAHELCALAVERFCEPRPARSAYYAPYHRRERSASETSLTLLLKALAETGREEDLSRVIRLVQQAPDRFRVDDCQVPCLKALIPWAQKRFGAVPAQLASWLGAVRRQLETATARPPAPPADWARPTEVTCACEYCTELKDFLADPAKEVGRITAAESARGHLISNIDQHRCDVKHTLERKGRPYSLVLTKTNGSFERAVKRYEDDRRLLNVLPPDP
jgi:hypothetical protein